MRQGRVSSPARRSPHPAAVRWGSEQGHVPSSGVAWRKRAACERAVGGAAGRATVKLCQPCLASIADGGKSGAAVHWRGQGFPGSHGPGHRIGDQGQGMVDHAVSCDRDTIRIGRGALFVRPLCDAGQSSVNAHDGVQRRAVKTVAGCTVDPSSTLPCQDPGRWKSDRGHLSDRARIPTIAWTGPEDRRPGSKIG